MTQSGHPNSRRNAALRLTLTLFDVRPAAQDVQTDCSVNATIKGKTYCFSSTDAKSQFMKNPSSNLTKAESFYKSEHKG